MGRVEPSQQDQQQQIDDLLEVERQREIQLQDTQAQHDLAVRHAEEARLSDQRLSDDKSASAVSGSSSQHARGAEWATFADRNDTNVPQSVKDIHEQSRKIEESNNARAAQDQHHQAMQKEAQQRITIASIMAEEAKKSGTFRG